MSTEIRVGGLFHQHDAEDDPPTSGEVATQDRVMHTVADRPHTETIPVPVDPAVEHDDDELMARRADIDEKHRRLADFLEARGYEGVLLGRADSIAWLTSGGELHRDLASESGSVTLFVNRQSRAVLADNVQSPRVFEEEVAGLGFHLKERPWHEPIDQTVAGLCRGRRIASDVPGLHDEAIDESARIRGLRLGLSRLDRQRMRELGRTLTLCMEATCRNFLPGETEADVAGHLAHRLLREGVTPVDLRVAGDDRLGRYRQPSFKATPIRRRAIVAATGRRFGLCASATRIVSFGPVDPEFRRDHALASMVEATYLYFSRVGEPVAEVVRRARRIFEKFGRPHEWTLDYQGFVTGFAPRELPLSPDCPMVLRPDYALRWSPSVGSARSEDTMVVDARGGFEVVTDAQRWPKLEVMVKGFNLPRPAILER